VILAIRQRAAGGLDDSPSAFQSDFWGDFKSEFGWRALRFEVEDGASSFKLLVLVDDLPAGFSFAYVPGGPSVEIGEGERSAFLAELAEGLRPFLPKLCLFLRFDPPWTCPDGSRPEIGAPLRRAASDVQPPDTVILSLRQSEDEILSSMKSKWRYNVRQAEKKGVVVEEAGLESLGLFYALSKVTAARDRIALRSEEYYARLFSLAARRRAERGDAGPQVSLWIARHEGKVLAANVTLFRGEEAFYLYGASADEDRNLMPTYALQWAAMRAAKRRGCSSYDLYGIPPSEDPEHPMAGLYRFKTGFGGEIVHRAGSWDYPLSPLYSIYRKAEAARAWYFKDFRKRRRS
jgi:lipid II:glycine glycyltransferase (peptidoglycan interpeptide bridge formation enzyme)